MKTVVVYASKYGSTKGIAEFIAEKLQQRGILAEVRDVEAVHDLGGFDALLQHASSSWCYSLTIALGRASSGMSRSNQNQTG